MKQKETGKFQTQIGKFAVFFDGELLQNEWQKMPNIRRHLEVDGRYCFKFEFINDNCPHSLKCILEDYSDKLDCGFESGEDLETIAFKSGDFKLSLGLKGIGVEEKNRFDYGITYLPYGLQYDIFPNTKTQAFTFCIAWVFKNSEDESRTWFAADVDYT